MTEPIDYDDDGFYDRHVGFDWSDLRVRVAAWVVSAALVAMLGVLVAKAAGAQSIPSVPVTGPQAKDAVYGAEIIFADKADAIVRQQPLAYLESVVAAMKPQVPPFIVGTVVGLGMNPGCAAGVYLTGWVAEAANRVQLKVDASVLHEAVLAPTMPGYPDTWTWCLPALYQDGADHRLYGTAYTGDGQTLGQIDNASTTVAYTFKVGTAPAPAFTVGTIAVTAPGVIGGEVVAEAVSVRLIIDGSEVAGALVPVTAGVWSWTVPARLRDGRRHAVGAYALRADGSRIGLIDGSATGGGGGFHLEMQP